MNHKINLAPVDFVQRLTEIQRPLYAYISTLLGGSSAVQDVVQETNLALWKKASEYDPTRLFQPWAFRFAHFQVMAHRRRCSRDRLVFDDELVELFASELEGEDADPSAEMEAMDNCIKKLPSQQQELIELRYFHNKSMDAIAADREQRAGTIAMTLCRIRKALLECIHTQLATNE